MVGLERLRIIRADLVGSLAAEPVLSCDLSKRQARWQHGQKCAGCCCSEKRQGEAVFGRCSRPRARKLHLHDVTSTLAVLPG